MNREQQHAEAGQIARNLEELDFDPDRVSVVPTEDGEVDVVYKGRGWMNSSDLRDMLVLADCFGVELYLDSEEFTLTFSQSPR